jgi:hypothetical protein
MDTQHTTTTTTTHNWLVSIANSRPLPRQSARQDPGDQDCSKALGQAKGTFHAMGHTTRSRTLLCSRLLGLTRGGGAREITNECATAPHLQPDVAGGVEEFVTSLEGIPLRSSRSLLHWPSSLTRRNAVLAAECSSSGVKWPSVVSIPSPAPVRLPSRAHS